MGAEEFGEGLQIDAAMAADKGDLFRLGSRGFANRVPTEIGDDFRPVRETRFVVSIFPAKDAPATDANSVRRLF